MPRQAPRRILAVQLRRLGDLVLATPAFHALKLAWPDARLVVLTEKPFDQVLEGNPDVNEVMIHSRRRLDAPGLAWRILRQRFDLAIDFHGNPTSARITGMSGAPVRVGWALRGRALAYTLKVKPAAPEPPRYTADQKLDLVRAMEIHAGDVRPRVFVSNVETEAASRRLREAGVDPDLPFVVAAPVSRRAYKEWPPERFAAALQAFRDASRAPIVLAGALEEEAPLRRVAALFSGPPPAVIPVATIREWVGLLERSRLFVGPDGGVKHIAQALNRSTLAIFGPQNPAVWTVPFSEVPHAVVAAKRRGCTIRCAGRPSACDCLAALEPGGVTARLLELWSAIVTTEAPA